MKLSPQYHLLTAKAVMAYPSSEGCGEGLVHRILLRCKINCGLDGISVIASGNGFRAYLLVNFCFL